MAKTLSTGSTIAIANGYGTSKSFSSITNATEAIASFSADPGLAVGEYFEVTTSGWGRLAERIVRVKAVSGTGPYLVTFEGIDTSDTTRFPPGSGAGTVREITGWDNLSQVKEVSSSGGDQQFADVTAIDDVETRQMPTVKSAVTMTLTVFDDPTLSWYSTVQAASDSMTPRALRITPANGAKILGNAYWSISGVPQITKNEAITTTISLSYASLPTRYAA